MGKKNKKLSYYFVKEQFAAADCELLEKDYINANTKMRYICSCGETSTITYANFSRGKRCKRCMGQRLAKQFKFSQNHAENYFKNKGCLLLDQYINSRISMNYICSCGNQTKISLDNLRAGKKCKKCWNKKQHAISKFSQSEVEKFFANSGCILLDKYTNTKIPVRYICVCGHESKTTFNSFKSGRRCKYCRQSRGEQAIELHLKTKGCKFEREYKSTCKNKKTLAFDFAIETATGLKLIEYQGRQHYEPVNFGSKKTDYKEEFKKIQKRDIKKKEWCQKNDIPLLAIPYKEFKNINIMLDAFL